MSPPPRRRASMNSIRLPIIKRRPESCRSNWMLKSKRRQTSRRRRLPRQSRLLRLRPRHRPKRKPTRCKRSKPSNSKLSCKSKPSRHKLNCRSRPRHKFNKQTRKKKWKFRSSNYQRRALTVAPQINSWLILLTKNQSQYPSTLKLQPMKAKLKTLSKWVLTSKILSLPQQTRSRSHQLRSQRPRTDKAQ